jgi:DNA-binding NarL/FixJ family response regulator
LDALINILLLEDENLVRQGVGGVVARQKGLRVLAEASTVNEALAVLDSCAEIDVVVADVMLGSEPGGLYLLEALNSRPTRPPVLLLSSYDEPWMYASALRGGALGYMLKGASLNELTSAIRSVAAGVAVFPAAALRDRYAARLPSPREREIMRLVADGFGNGEIGGRLGIKEKTVESHLTRLFARYGVGSRTELALLASKQGWIGRRTVGSR